MNARPLAKNRPLSAEQMQQMARENMGAHFVVLRNAGRTRARNPEEFYGFRPEDVAALHLHKHGVGRGVWFRLKDGRVIDAYGKPAERDRVWYVSSRHRSTRRNDCW